MEYQNTTILHVRSHLNMGPTIKCMLLYLFKLLSLSENTQTIVSGSLKSFEHLYTCYHCT